MVDASNGQTVTGTAEPGSTVVVNDAKGTPIGSAVADTNGKYSITVSPKAADKAVLSVTATDAVGNVSDKASVTVDAAAPAVPKVDASNGQTVTGTAEAGSSVVVKDSEGKAIGTGVADTNGKYSITVSPKAADKAVLSVTATDAVGNTSDKGSVTVDAAAPAVPKVDATNGQTVTGTAEPGSNVVVKDSAGTPIGSAVADASGKYSIPVNPQAADKAVLSVTATDAVGNTSDKATATVDGIAPMISIAIVSDKNGDGIINAAEISEGVSVKVTLVSGAAVGDVISVTGGTSPAKTVTLTTADVTNGSVLVNIPAPATDGPFPISVTSKDLAGNANTVSQLLSVDTTGPTAGYRIAITVFVDDQEPLVGEFKSGSNTDDTTPMLKGTVSGLAKGDVVQIFEGLSLLGTAIVATDGTWTYQLSEKAPGTYSYTAKIFDAAGNPGLASEPLTLNVVTAPPTATAAITAIADDTGLSASDFITSDQTLVVTAKVTGTVGAGEKVQISLDNGLNWNDAKLVSGSTYQFDNSAKTLNDGSYTFQARVVNGAGIASKAGTQVVVIDHVAPSASDTVAITFFKDDVGTVQGDFPSGTRTDDTTPLLKGTVTGLVAGDVVQIFEGGKLLGTANVVNNSWTYALGEKTPASYTYTAKIVDVAGNVGTVSQDFTLVVDTTVSASSLTSVSITTDTNNDGVINVAELNGSATVGVTVKFAPGNVAVGDTIRVTDGITTTLLPVKATDKQAGSVSTTFAAPAEGQTITVTATVTNAAGNSSASAVTDSAVRNTVAPTNTTTIDSYTDDAGPRKGDFGRGTYTDDTQIVLNGTLAAPLADGETVTGFSQGALIGDPRVPIPDKAVMIDATHWTLQVAYRGYPLEIYYAKVTNTAGNDSPLSQKFDVHFLMTPPVGTITVDPLVTVDTTPTLSGKVTGLSKDDVRTGTDTVTVAVNGVTYTAGDGNLTVSGSTWKLKIPEANAINVDGGDDLKLDVVASIVNSAGVPTSDTTTGELTVYRDITISPLPDATHVSTSKPALIGAGHVGANESLTVQVLNSKGSVVKAFIGTDPDSGAATDPTSAGALSFNGFGGWSIADSNWGDIPLLPGKYTVRAFTKVADGSGGQVAADSTFTVVDLAASPRTMVNTLYSDTAPKAYALADGGYMLFYTSSANSDASDYNLYAQRYAANGAKNGSQIVVAASNVSEAQPWREDMIYTYGYGARVKGDGSFNVFYTTNQSDGYQYYVKDFNRAGVATVTTPIYKKGDYAFDPNYVQLSDGSYVVVFSSGTVHNYNLYALRYTSAGVAKDVDKPVALTNEVDHSHGYDYDPSFLPAGAEETETHPISRALPRSVWAIVRIWFRTWSWSMACRAPMPSTSSCAHTPSTEAGRWAPLSRPAPKPPLRRSAPSWFP
ncbi:Ig-like domain-containing protein [Variovorax sp. E3]|uniref:Ig-like domain-containing protein n=1 Tax=Variovorax sp. E3 TaxID=1914993 RepID=UPI0018DE9546|nr:Ig-like domain-containing protein [Variovorax sp. E3]